MTRISNKSGRPYRSQLREEHAEQTRSRILEATVRVMARGLVGLSIPEVAREAGVSVPTIYRQFGTKDELVAAVYPHVRRRAGINQPPPPRSMDELRDGVRVYFGSLDTLDDLDRAAMASPASEEVRRVTMPDRLAMFRQFAQSVAPKSSKSDRERITRLVAILTASAAQRMWRDHFGASVEEATDDIEWMVRAAIAAATPGSSR